VPFEALVELSQERSDAGFDNIRKLPTIIKQGGINLEVKVIDNDVEKALKILKNKLSKSGLFKELKVRRAYEKPSVKQKRKTIEAQRRLAKVQRRRRY
jgi:small subunit ribosomal protein S21